MLLADRVAAGVAQENADLPGTERVLGPHEDRDDEPALEVARQQTDRPCAARKQPTRQRVGRESESSGGIVNPLPRRLGHLLAAVQGLRGRRDGHPGQPRDVRERDGTLRSPGGRAGHRTSLRSRWAVRRCRTVTGRTPRRLPDPALWSEKPFGPFRYAALSARA